MEFEYWWLLAFPLFFGLGWLAARIDIKQIVSESRALPGSYFKGLNFLLNEQPDKAIEAFIEVVKVDPQTIELHFALGGLFRRRGEVERAIRMHQNLAERPDLGAAQRRQAVFELAQDYLKAGLLDRAEEHFSQLLGTDLDEQAASFLLEIYQQEKEWEKAIATAGLLEAHTGQSRQKEIAHFECEVASREIMQSRFDAARPHLTQALARHRLCVRANMLSGDLEEALGNDDAALGAWKRIESQNPEFLPLVAERMLSAYRRLGRVEEGLTLLKGYLARYASIDLLNVAFQAELETAGTESAYRLVREELRRNPTLLGLDKLLEAQMLEVPAARRPDLELVKNLVHQHTRSLAMYRCDHCGFRARQFYWRCPACNGWETYSPRRTEEKGLAK
ncbi:MAG: lipopolysaccharide assembly protein LapB [Burkholderiales bacterium]|nr:lipopolysaccharide assembly protein LapB [Burkholderiales bacterium]